MGLQWSQECGFRNVARPGWYHRSHCLPKMATNWGKPFYQLTTKIQLRYTPQSNDLPVDVPKPVP